jgi:hypothetical protein
MSKQHGVREQKRLAKLKAKREARRRQLELRSSSNPVIRLKAADGWPVTASLVPENLWSMGIGNLLIARRTPDGRLACGIFLVDVFCLGVKDAVWKLVDTGQFNSLCRDLEAHGRLAKVTPEHFAKLVYRAADYGQSLGFPPHRDFRHAQRLLAGIDPSRCPDEFEFGHEGQPLYIRGPSESMDKARIIAARVHALGGNYTVPLQRAEVPPELIAMVEADDEYKDDNEPGDEEDQSRRWPWLPWR